ncbi:hypothetical protein K4749_01420 [Streptomyces sp. TRM72054]|uniref:hypothetical protein n=1 Tax=Streptomyces sp. TRM72054 TaxID=2870562 RepID=UPI001C8C2B5E|nr:hypothetical protein [Streptomyces sp. TRM72054]MBX9392290.1 hypothetical protein [Streptomyces sp. TRM72054]
MNAADVVWGGLILAGAAFEVCALRNARQGDTLSESTRRWFRVHTKAGAIVFGVAWVGFSVWFLDHILG